MSSKVTGDGPRLLATIALGPTELRMTWVPSSEGGALQLSLEVGAKAVPQLALGISKACAESTLAAIKRGRP